MPHNILLFEETIAIDYLNFKRYFSTTHDTEYYKAPEIVNGNPATDKSDVWAIGMIVNQLSSIIPKDYHLTPCFRHFIECCLKHDPSERWSTAKLLNVYKELV